MLKQTNRIKVQAPAQQYLDVIAKEIERIREDLPALIGMGERMAELMLEGGELFNPPVNPYWPSEFGGRAGGFMGIRSRPGLAASPKNVAYFALPDPRHWKPEKDKTLQELLDGKAKLFVVGKEEDLPQGILKLAKGRITFAGGPESSDLSLRHFHQFVRGWIVAGEMFGACTRAGKTPVLWMSVWLEGALPRNMHFFKHDNLREPWDTPFFHDGHYVPPLNRGYAGGAFLDELESIHGHLVDQTDRLATAGQWMADARRARKRIWTVAVGHSYPQILELKHNPKHPLEWGHSYSDLTKAMPADLGKGDVALHFGYAPVNNADVQMLLKRGMKLIHSSPYGNSMNPVKRKDFLYLDLPWRPADATVDIPGYSVRICPMSSSAQTVALNAILAEMSARSR
jgi:hypothetical protein